MLIAASAKRLNVDSKILNGDDDFKGGVVSGRLHVACDVTGSNVYSDSGQCYMYRY